MAYRVLFAGPVAAKRFQTLPERVRRVFIDRVAELTERLWDASVAWPGEDRASREAMFGGGRGIIAFYVDDDAEEIRIADVLWLG